MITYLILEFFMFDLDCESPIFNLIASGNLVEVQLSITNNQLLLENKVSNGASLYHIAAFHGHLPIIQWFESMGYHTRMAPKDNQGCTALMYAVSNGHIQIIDHIVNGSKESYFDRDNKNQNVLMVAIESKNLNVVKKLIELEKQIRNSPQVNSLYEQNHLGMTPILYAVFRGRNSITQWLCNEYGVSLLQTKTKNDETALMYAASFGNLPLVIWLMSKLDPSKLLDVDKTSKTVLRHAVLGGHLPVIQWLLEHGANNLLKKEENTILFYAASQENTDVLKYLIEKGGLDLLKHEKDDSQTTLLMVAAKKGYLQHIKYLVTIDDQQLLLKKDSKGHSVYTYALKGMQASVLRWLQEVAPLEFIKEKEQLNFTALLHTAYIGKAEVVEFLIETNRDLLHKKNAKGQSVIMYAARAGQLDVVKTLVKFGGNEILKDRDNDGKTALLSTCCMDMTLTSKAESFKEEQFIIGDPQCEVLKWLLSNECSGELLTQTDNNAWNVFDHSVKNRNTKFLGYLINTGQFNFSGINTSAENSIEKTLSEFDLSCELSKKVLFLLQNEARRQRKELIIPKFSSETTSTLSVFEKNRQQTINFFIDFSSLLINYFGNSIAKILQSYTEDDKEEHWLYLSSTDQKWVYKLLEIQANYFQTLHNYTNNLENSNFPSLEPLKSKLESLNSSLILIKGELGIFKKPSKRLHSSALQGSDFNPEISTETESKKLAR